VRRPALAYVPGSSPLHRASAGASVAFLGALAAIAFAYSSPLILLGVGAAAALAGVAAGAGRAVAAAARISLPLVVLMIAVNALVYHRGDTVLVRGWTTPVLGNTDVTLESLVAGAAIGLRVAVVVGVFAVYSACVDPDRVLRALFPLARRSALTAALVARLVPLAASDLGRLREASALRGPGAAPVGRAVLARRLVAGSLDRAVDVAATLELRGHSLPAPARPRRRRSLSDRPLLLAAGLLVAAAALGALAGAGRYDTYPRIALSLDPATVALAAAIPVLALLPFGPPRGGGWRPRRGRRAVGGRRPLAAGSAPGGERG
jgi:energy-coupling factor transport system permease protein